MVFWMIKIYFIFKDIRKWRYIRKEMKVTWAIYFRQTLIYILILLHFFLFVPFSFSLLLSLFISISIYIRRRFSFFRYQSIICHYWHSVLSDLQFISTKLQLLKHTLLSIFFSAFSIFQNLIRQETCFSHIKTKSINYIPQQ